MENNIANCERMIMKIVWNSQDDITITQLSARLKTQFGKEYARTTVVTLMKRLADKGFLSTYRKGKNTYIHVEIKEDEYLPTFISDFVNMWCEEDASKFLYMLSKKRKLSIREIERIKTIIGENYSN